MRLHNQVADPQTGYVLNKRRSYFEIICPEETINLVTDPHFVIKSSYSNFYGGTFSFQGATQRRGSTAARVVTTNNSTGFGFFLSGNLTANNYYTFSLDLLGIGSYSLYFSNNTGTILGQAKQVKCSGFWQRVWITEYIRRSDIISVAILADSPATFYVDGFQVENKDHPTTFVSGALASARGPRDYAWLGAPNRSMSYRSAQAIDGGRVVPLSDLGFDVMEFNQLGFSESTNFFEDYAILPGSQYMGSHMGRRTFTLTGNIFGEELKKLLCKRNSLGTAITGGGSERTKPVTLGFQLYEDDAPTSDELIIKAIYKSGLEGNINNLYQEKAAIIFETSNTMIEQDGITSSALEIIETLPGTTNAIGINKDGVVVDLASGCVGSSPFGFVIGPDNNLYTSCGHTLRQYNGAAWSTVYTHPDSWTLTALEVGGDGRIYFATNHSNTSELIAFDLRTGSADYLGGADFNPLSSTGTISVIRRGFSNELYIGGAFSHINNTQSGTIAALNVCKFNISTYIFTALGTGLGTDAGFGSCEVLALCLDSHGLVWAGGNFSNGSAIDDDIHNLAVWDTVQWEKVGNFSASSSISMGQIENATIYALAYDGARDIVYVGGRFVAFRTVPVNTVVIQNLGNVAAIKVKDRDFYQFGRPDVNPVLAGIDSVTPLGAGVGYNGLLVGSIGDLGFYGEVLGLAVACDGRLAVVGTFDSAINPAVGSTPLSYVSATGIAFWNPNSTKWEISPVSLSAIDHILYKDYIVYIVGYGGNCKQGALTLGDYTVGSSVFDSVLSTTFVQPGFSDSFFFNMVAEHTTTSAVVNQVDNTCAASVRPVIQIVGPGTIETIRNYTNNKYINVRDKTLFAGEVVLIDTTPDNYGMYSNYVGEQTNLIDVGSSFPNFSLEPGINQVVVKMSGTSGDSSVAFLWKKQYASIDAACEGSCIQ